MNTPFRTPGVPGLLTDDALAEQMKQFTQAQNTQAQAAPPPDAAVEFADRIQSEYLSAPARRMKALAPAAGVLGPLVSGLASSTSKSQASGPAPRDETLGGKIIANPFISLMQGGTLARAGTLSDDEAQVEAEAKFEQAQQDEAAILKTRDELVARQEAERQQSSFGGLGAEVDEDARVEALAQMDLNVADAQAETKTRKEGLTDRDKQPTQTWWLSALQGGVRQLVQTPVTAAKAPISAWEGVTAALTGQTWEDKSDLREWVDVVDKNLTKILPGDKTRSKEFVDQLGQGSGSMMAFMLAGYVTATVGLPAAVGTTLFGSAVGAQSQLEDAETHDGVGLNKYLSFLAGGALGATEAIPINNMFMRAERATGGMVSRMLRTTTAGSLEEFVQEMGQSFGTDVVARWLYDENRDIDIGAYVKQGLVGAVIGGAAGLSASVAGQAGMTPDQMAAENIPEAEKTGIVERVLGGLKSEFDTAVAADEAAAGVVRPEPEADLLAARAPLSEAETRLNQMVYDRSQATKRGEDTKGDSYAQVNAEIRRLRKTVKEEQIDLLAARAPAPSVDTPEFKKWFGDSKVVDADGKPLVVYHGGAADIEAFDPAGKAGTRKVGTPDFGNFGVGVYATPAEFVAKAYAGRSGAVYPLYASIKNPLKITVAGPEYTQEVERIAAELGVTATPRWEGSGQKDKDFATQFRDKAMAAGYDGVITENLDGSMGAEVVAFEPTQIKSVNNRGTFDPNNPEILAMAGTSSTRGAYAAEQTRPVRGVPTTPGQTEDADTDLHLSSISNDVVRALDLTARQGRLTLKGSNIMGQFSTRQGVVRVRTWDDLSTLVHEGGHALEQSAGAALKSFISRNQNALMQAGTDLYGGDTKTMSKTEHTAEGFAEFFRVFTLNRAYAEQKYPKLATEFIDTLTTDAPTLLASLDNIGKRFAAWLQLPSSQLVSNMVVEGKRPVGFDRTLQEMKEAGFATWYNAFIHKSVTASLNKYAPLNKLVNDIVDKTGKSGNLIDLKAAEDPRILARLMANSGSRAQVQLSDGVMGHRSVSPMSRSLREALLRYHGLGPDQNLGQIDPTRQRDFAGYLIALRGIDEYRRLDEGKIERPPVAATRGDLALAVQEMDAKYGNDFRIAAEIVHEYGMALWKKQYDAGLMTRDTYKDGLERQFYAPLQRDMTDKKGVFGQAQTNAGTAGAPSIVKRFKGSDRRIIDPMDVLMQKTFALEKSIAQNEVKRTLAALADKAGTVGALVERVPATQMIGKQYTVRDVARQLTRDDTLTEADAADLMLMLDGSIENDNVLTMFGSQQASAKGENIVFFWEHGKVAAIQLNDGEIGFDVMNTLNGLGKETIPWYVDLVAQTSSVFRSAITLWPDFLVVNFIRDQMSTFILTDVGFKPFVTGIKGAREEIRQAEWARQYNASMASVGGMGVASLHRARVESDIAALRKKGYRARLFNEGSLRGFTRFAELTETGTRQGLYRKAFERAQKDGLNDWDASVEAAYAATDIMDFGLHGSQTAIVRRTIPFFGAQLNGLYKMLRTLGGDEVRQRKGLTFALSAYFKNINNLELTRREKQALQTGRKAWVKMASLGLFSAALHFLFEDDPDYQEAGEYLRTTGWVLPLGDGKIAYIPKPFELAVLANFTERAIEFGSGDPEAKNRFLRGLAMTLTPPGSPPALQLLTEQLANYDFFSGREIVPDYMQALSGELQYNNYTSSIARTIADVTGWSAMKVDHALSGLGASAYRDISNTINAVDSSRPAMDKADLPIVRRFIRDARRGSTTSQDFWRFASTTNGLLREAELTYRTYLEAGNEQAANGFLETLDEDTKAYALLNANFKAEAKRLNPFYRNRQIATVVSAMRRELGGELGLDDTTTKTSEAFRLTRRERLEADTALSEIIRRETRNTLVYAKSPGWANRKPLDVEKTMELLGAVEPRVLEELQRRLAKAKVYKAETVQEYWPEVKDRLLSDRENTFLKDIVSIAEATR